MALSQDRAICLRRLDYSETSQILLLFTRAHGLLRVIAKGAHRRTKAGASKFDGGLDLLDLGTAVFIHSTERELSTLTEWGLVDGHLALRGGLRPVYLAQYAAELVSSLLEEHDPHPDLFDLLEALLQDLETDRREEAFLTFELALLQHTGYLPSFTTCASCHRPVAGGASEPGHFSAALSGVICRACEGVTHDRSAFDSRLIRLTQGLLLQPSRLPRLTRHQSDPINRLLATHVEQTLQRRLKLARYVLPAMPANTPALARA